jgi:hypothetical protein
LQCGVQLLIAIVYAVVIVAMGVSHFAPNISMKKDGEEKDSAAPAHGSQVWQEQACLSLSSFSCLRPRV